MINNTRRKKKNGYRWKEANAGPFSGPKAIYRKILPLLWNTAKTTNIIYIYEKGGEPVGTKKEVKRALKNENGTKKKKKTPRKRGKTIFLIRFGNCVYI